MRQIVKDGQLFDRRVYESKDQARAELANEPYKLELVDDKSGDPDVMEVGGDELTAYDNLNPRTRERIWGDLCRGPHIPTTKHIPAFKLTRSSAAYWRGDQKNASLQRIYGTAWESQEALDRHLELIEEAQRRDHRKLGVELDLFSFPDEIGSGLAGFPPQGRRRAQGTGGVLAAQAHRGRVRIRQYPAHHQGAAVPHVGPPGLVRRRHVPADAPRRRVQRRRNGAQAGPGLLPQADELPDAHPDLRLARAVVSRASVAALRIRHRVPLREVRCGARADPRARVHHGRLAHLLHPRAAARRTGVAAAVRARVAQRLRAGGLLSGAVHQGPREVRRLRRGVGGGHQHAGRRRPASRACELVPDPGGAAFYGPKISVQARDALGRSWQMSTIQVDFNFPERFDLEYTAAGRDPAAAGDDPPGTVRVDRAVLRHPHRALRGGVPGVAGAGSGGRHPGRRRARAPTWKALPRS